MIKVAIVGYGNIGKYAVDALRAAPDMELAGIVRRPGSEAVHGIKTVSDVEELGHVDAALLCTPTRSVEETALPLLARGINTVDSFDIHGDIVSTILAFVFGASPNVTGAPENIFDFVLSSQ